MKQVINVIVLNFCLLTFFGCEDNVNEPSVDDQEFKVNENAPEGTIIGVIQAFDLDPGQGLSYWMLETDYASTLEIDHGSGHISVLDPAMLNYEVNTEIEFTAMVGDDGNPAKESSARITIIIEDLNEFAPVVDDQVFEIAEGPAKGALIGTIQASDQEMHQMLLYTILSGNEDEAFEIDDQTGILTVNDPAAFDFDVNQQLSLTVMVRDLHIDSKTDTALITINIMQS
jgi:hypothetical protein